ncbi:MAG: hypothetical protein AAGA86_14325 [Bacteroidota bacterium]
MPGANIYIIKNKSNNAIAISSFIRDTGTVGSTVPANSIIQLQSSGANWELITSSASRLSNKSYVQTFTQNKVFDNGDAQLLNLFPQLTIQPNKKVKLTMYIPTRADTRNWGGLFVNVNVNVNGTWYNLGNTGFDSGAMNNGAGIIHALNHQMLLDFVQHLNLDPNLPYTIQFELTARSHTDATYVNQGHRMNDTSNNLGSRGGYNDGLPIRTIAI